MADLATEWAKDEDHDTCSLCGTEFWLLRRKHHCRFCGLIFCAQCSQHELAVGDGLGRACNICATLHSNKHQTDCSQTKVDSVLHKLGPFTETTPFPERVVVRGVRLFSVSAGVKGLGCVRVASVDVPVELSKVVALWDWAQLSLWDAANTVASRVQQIGENRQLIYYRVKPRPFFAARDFSFFSVSEQLSTDSYRMVQCSCPSEMPLVEGAVRGETDSIIVATRVGQATRIVYVNEIDAKGPVVLPLALVKHFVDATIVGSLANFRAYAIRAGREGHHQRKHHSGGDDDDDSSYASAEEGIDEDLTDVGDAKRGSTPSTEAARPDDVEPSPPAASYVTPFDAALDAVFARLSPLMDLKSGRLQLNTTVNVPVSELRSMWIWEEYADWDKEFTSSSRVVETVHEHQRIVHIITRALSRPLLLQREDVFAAMSATFSRLDRTAILLKSPRRYVTEFDPRGWIPLNVVNLAADEVCLTLNNFKTMAEEKWRRMQGGAASG